MRLRKWSRTVGIIGLVGLLSACSLMNGFAGNATTPLVSNGHGLSTTKSHSHYRHETATNKYAASDNDASADYFNNINADASDQNNLWVAIRQDFQLNHYPNDPEVKAQIAWFMHNQGYLDRTARRAAPFMYYIYQEVKARNLPSELVLLPIIESAYNPFVSSSAGAVGLWQLVPGTARTFGVRQDWWYDGRRDITASTKAALDYLTYLQNFFGGDWLLAIAAYDTGEGNVAAAIHRNARRGLNTDFWALPLANETQSYVPRLLALAAIINDPKDYPVNLPPINNSPYLGEVEISAQITLEQAASLAGVSLSELKTLNPGYRHSTLDPNQPYKLLLPIDRVQFFRQNLLHEPTSQSGLWGRYKIQSGDTWRKIAKQFNTSIGLLQQINHITSHTPPVGAILLIPENQSNEAAIATATTTQSTGSTNDTVNTTNTMSNATNENENDTTSNEVSDASDAIAEPDLSDAANLDASAMKAVDKQNAISTSHHLHLYKIMHTVKAGESLASIAKLHQVSIEDLARWNHLSPHVKLKQNAKIIIWKKMGNTAHTTHHHLAHQTHHTISKKTHLKKSLA